MPEIIVLKKRKLDPEELRVQLSLMEVKAAALEAENETLRRQNELYVGMLRAERKRRMRMYRAMLKKENRKTSKLERGMLGVLALMAH